MPINISVPEMTELKPRISVIGVGGAGGNAVNNMIDSALEGVEFIVANTDAQAVGLSKAPKKIQLGVNTTQGLGAGSMPNIGSAAAEESLEEILEHVGNSHMLFVTAGMGGGTGTGAAPVIAQAAKERDILTVGVVTKPFHFEGARRMRVAMAGIEELQKHVDTLLIIPNQNLFSIADERTTFHEAFAMADEVLHSGVRGITDLMVMPGLINLDFADVRTVMGEMGQAMMGTGEADGEKRAIEAAEAAISNPLLDKVSMKGARGVLINITGSMDMKLFEIDEAANRIRAEVDPDANIIIGSTFNQELEGKVRVSVVATGIDMEYTENSHSSQGADASAAQAATQNVMPGAIDQNSAMPTAKPWRQPALAQTTAPVTVQSNASEVKKGNGLAAQNTQASVTMRNDKTQDGANPVGDVQARIRKLLTEGEGSGLSTRNATVDELKANMPAQSSDEDMNGRNPFRGVTARSASLGSAMGGMLKNLTASPSSATSSDQEISEKKSDNPQRTPVVKRNTTSVPSTRQVSGDLFEDDVDNELEIPAFLRKKKIG